MDTKLMEYVIKISEERSITKAAEKLFITQSALNQQLQKLETELGSPLFVRTRSDWHLTSAGEIYVKTAREILSLKKDAYSQIQDLRERGNRCITIGLIPERGVNMFTAIYPEFHRQFPDVRIEPVECNVRMMQEKIKKNEIDLGLVTLSPFQKDENTYIHMADEELFLAVSANHRLAHLGSADAQHAPEISLSRFLEDPFILMSSSSTMHQLESALFEQAGFWPEVLFSTSSNISKYRMVLADVGCALLPQVFAVPTPGIVFFRLDEHPSWEITMCCRKNAYLSSAERAFLKLCQEYWSRIFSSKEGDSLV